MANEKPIIVIKKVAGHGGHHGGAWKVAYADFITAMMAFFLVMWIVNSTSDATRAGIAEYFNNPINDSGFFNTNGSASVIPGNSGILDHPFSPHDSTKSEMPYEKSLIHGPNNGDDELVDIKEGFFKPNMPVPLDEGEKPIEDEENIEDLKEIINTDYTQIKNVSKTNASLLSEKLQSEIEKDPVLISSLGTIEIQVEPDGMVFEIMDTDKYSMFESGSAIITSQAKEAFIKVFNLLEPFKNKIEILGHTDAIPYNSRSVGGYSNWELSTDRANAARRLIKETKIPESRIVGVIGRADKYPRLKTDPNSAVNRRIAIKLRFDESDKLQPTKKIQEKNKEFRERNKFSQKNTNNNKVAEVTEVSKNTEKVEESTVTGTTEETTSTEAKEKSVPPTSESSPNPENGNQEDATPKENEHAKVEAVGFFTSYVTPTMTIQNR